jgi:drug/metabolite transporter (DMT)-like permease
LGESILLITLAGGMIILLGVRLVQKSYKNNYDETKETKEGVE